MAKQIGTATRESATKQARELIARGGNNGHPAVVGKLFHSPRRYSWGIRFADEVAHAFEDGSRWEPVEVIREATAA